MLTIRATLEPNGHVRLPASVRCEKPMAVLVTFLDEAEDLPSSSVNSTETGNVAATLKILHSPEFRQLPKSNAEEIQQRIQTLRDDWAN